MRRRCLRRLRGRSRKCPTVRTAIASLRGAQRRSNPCRRAVSLLDCFASLKRNSSLDHCFVSLNAQKPPTPSSRATAKRSRLSRRTVLFGHSEDVVSHGPSLDRFALLAMTAGQPNPVSSKRVGRRPVLNSQWMAEATRLPIVDRDEWRGRDRCARTGVAATKSQEFRPCPLPAMPAFAIASCSSPAALEARRDPEVGARDACSDTRARQS